MAEPSISQANSKSVLDTYANVFARQVDLVGDYAGAELFIVHAESLLLHCFTTSGVDFKEGLQVLHAIYNVESFLQKLILRKCNYHIVFFDDHKHMCVPAYAERQDQSKYLFARAVALRHLQANLRLRYPHIEIHHFPSTTSPAWRKYLQASGTYFVMCHDGALPVDDHNSPGDDTEDQISSSSNADSEGDEDSSDSLETGGTSSPGVPVATIKRVHARLMILSFLKKGYNVALVNGLAFRDSKVMTMVLEGSRKNLLGQEELLGLAFLHISSKHEDTSSDDKTDEIRTHLSSQAYQLTVLAIRKMLNDRCFSEKLALGLILQVALIRQIPLSSRRVACDRVAPQTDAFMVLFANNASQLLQSDSWSERPPRGSERDLADCMDGLVFQAVMHHLTTTSPRITLQAEIKEDIKRMIAALETIGGPRLSTDLIESTTQDIISESPKAETTSSVAVDLLPFSNPVLDPHMKSIRLSVNNGEVFSDSKGSKIFKEISHWHNAKKSLPSSRVPVNVAQKAKERELKRNQIFMREMIAYSSSLTGATGKILEAETIVVQNSENTRAPQNKLNASKENNSAGPGSATSKKNQKPGASQKKGSKKEALLADIAAQNAKKGEMNEKKMFDSWKWYLENNVKPLPSEILKYGKAYDYLQILPSEKRQVLAGEVELFMLSMLLRIWIQSCRDKQRPAGIAALLWNHVNNLGRLQKPFSSTHISLIKKVCRSLNVPAPPLEQTASDQALSFPFVTPDKTDGDIQLGRDPRIFQLVHCGPYLDRSIDSSQDDRVPFNPDAWQKRVLDLIDADRSIFVVAPTSAGKTFISFYAMKRILKNDDDGVLVYVAPTKALVNQIAAEIQGRFQKSYNRDAKSVWAIHTRDYRINSPTGCQVLVTVPHILQILLLSPGNANSWASRVKRIIFDEIHSIGQAEDGVVWEQLLLLAPCPIIALSATVGNTFEFSDWLNSTQKSIGCNLEMVQHPHRYSDLRKYVFHSSPTFALTGLPEPETNLGMLGLDLDSSFAFLHPVASLVNRSRGMPDDLNLEPRDCWSLWNAMKKYATAKYPLDKALEPEQSLPDTVRKIDVFGWEERLKKVLQEWMAAEDSPFDAVVKELSPPQPYAPANKESEDDLVKTTTSLLVSLNANNALPAILFNYDRSMCEKLAEAVIQDLRSCEEEYKTTSKQWAKKLESWTQYKKAQEANTKKPAPKPKKSAASKQDIEEGTSRLDLQREQAEAEMNPWESFDPNAPLDNFCFSNRKVLQQSELNHYLARLRRKGTADWLLEALARGIGVHHAGMNRMYRQTVEILFRKGFLRVVIATGTLALGINMPAKTAVFSGDSVFLTALNFRQAAGRAGRRGFDLLGNVVFHGIPMEKVCRLISSRLPDLNGHFPITTSLVLRLFILLHESGNSTYAQTAINTLLSQPRLFLGGQSFKDQVVHHLRFSIEYLRRQDLLGVGGTPLNFAGCIAHLYYTEQSSFAFHTLLKEGFFHNLTASLNPKNEDRITLTLMLVMAHLFGRRPLRQSDLEPENYKKRIHNSPSVVFLPPMPHDAKIILRAHNRQTLDIFSNYAKTFAEQHLSDTEDNRLPLTGLKCGGDSDQANPRSESYSAILGAPPKKTPTVVRSAFTALSGYTDDFSSISELCNTARDGIFLEESVIPYVTIYPEETSVPLNAYLYDFFKHGDVAALAKANGIRKGDVWFVLNDFSLVLATITTSLKNFLNLTPDASTDMLDVQSSADKAEEHQSYEAMAQAVESEEPSGDPTTPAKSGGSGANSSTSGVPGSGSNATKEAKNKKKAAVAESWEDEAEDEVEPNASEEKTPAAPQSDKAKGKKSPRISRRGRSQSGTVDDDDAAQERYPKFDPNTSGGLLNVLKAFEILQARFDEKFKAMWA